MLLQMGQGKSILHHIEDSTPGHVRSHAEGESDSI